MDLATVLQLARFEPAACDAAPARLSRGLYSEAVGIFDIGLEARCWSRPSLAAAIGRGQLRR